MRDILGLDISLTSFGWCLQSGSNIPVYGSFKTTPKDGLHIERFILQRNRFKDLSLKYNVDHIGIEQPLKRTWNTELLYALHQFVLEVCYNNHIKVVYITPAQIKTYVTGGNSQAEKSDIIFKTKQILGYKNRINDDECDAYWISILANKFWSFYYKEISESELISAEYDIFVQTKKKKPGIIKKLNDAYYIF